MSSTPAQSGARTNLLRASAHWPGSLLASMRIRKKLIVLHTTFSLVLAGVLLFVLRPQIQRVVEQSERHEVALAISFIRAKLQQTENGAGNVRTQAARDALLGELEAAMPTGVTLRVGQGERLGINALVLEQARATPETLVDFTQPDGSTAAVVIDEFDGSAYVATARLEEARAGVVRVYVLATIVLLAVYALIAMALEFFILPRYVYRPIRRLLLADAAVQAGDRESEMIPAEEIPADEMGEIMRSRNATILAMRRHEADLALALGRLETLAGDLHKKNELLEAAQRNLADADKLASLGILSAGLAHEMNTPLAVVKGLAEKLAAQPATTLGDAPAGGSLSPDESALLLRVVGRLERLSESLLDFARVRPGRRLRTPLRPLIIEAWTLVRLDRESRRVEFSCDIDASVEIVCDPDRLTQVFVNLLRNAVDATSSRRATMKAPASAEVGVSATFDRSGGITIRVNDSGPGLDPAILPRLFEPFASTRLDARGTGLGLAVSQGIIREHAGVLTARNRDDAPGAVFEIFLPEVAQATDAPASITNAREPRVPTPT
ncbi:MAG: HAMP domain-containing histidine kinase [Phycisphaerales bacterium]|nr:HAMP domain-containing histidine kinase [Phycisphaerales bacterium]